MTKDDSDALVFGKWIVVGGIFIQLFFFGFFMVVSVVFYTRISRQPSVRSQITGISWRMQMWILFTASGLIMIRSVIQILYSHSCTFYIHRYHYCNADDVWFHEEKGHDRY